MSQKRIYVAAGVILSSAGDHPPKILLAKRPSDKHQGGLWEFPGGKVDEGEEVYAALCRELKEELNIQVLTAEPFIEIRHDYSDKLITLDVWLVTAFEGNACGAEGQEVKWVPVTVLAEFEFPAANDDIVKAIEQKFYQL